MVSPQRVTRRPCGASSRRRIADEVAVEAEDLPGVHHAVPGQTRSRPVGVTTIEPRDTSDEQVTAYAALIRLVRRSKNAIRTLDAALRQLRLYSVRPADDVVQWADQRADCRRLLHAQWLCR